MINHSDDEILTLSKLEDGETQENLEINYKSRNEKNNSKFLQDVHCIISLPTILQSNENMEKIGLDPEFKNEGMQLKDFYKCNCGRDFDKLILAFQS
jgi:hypothetical protein